MPEGTIVPLQGGSRKASSTARAVALFRHMAGTDTLAVRFITSRQRRLGALLRWLQFDRIVLGFCSAIAARQLYIDQRMADAPLRQVVILGAGFDTRPWRLPGLQNAQTFIVDHPETARERAAARQAAGLPCRAVRVDVDLARDALLPRLEAAGFSPQQPTLWVWEGVSMYLTQDQVRETLAELRAASAAGSRLLFDTWSPPYRGWQYTYEGLARSVLRRLGEPLRFTPAAAEVQQLCAQQGWKITAQNRCHQVSGFRHAHQALLLVEAQCA